MLSSLMFLSAVQNQMAQAQSRPVSDLSGLVLLASMLSGGKKSNGPSIPERSRLLKMTLRDLFQNCYRLDRNLKKSTIDSYKTSLDRIAEAFGREIRVKDLTYGVYRDFRIWLAARIACGNSPATTNSHLRILHLLWEYAAAVRRTDSGKKWRAIKKPPIFDFFPEPEINVNAWTLEDLATIEAQSRLQTGYVGGVPADIFWTAWVLEIQKIGCRITAMMLTPRDCYDAQARTILLRREVQKQKQDQRIALPPRTAMAIERLLAAHNHPLIYGCWPFDPPERSGKQKWRVLTKHFVKNILEPAGLTLPKYVKTKQFRRTAATICRENGGNPQELLGHSSPKVTARYTDRKRQPICRQSLLIPDGADPQRKLF